MVIKSWPEQRFDRKFFFLTHEAAQRRIKAETISVIKICLIRQKSPLQMVNSVYEHSREKTTKNRKLARD